MKEIVFTIAIFCVCAFGFFLLSRLDRFLNENRKGMESESEKKEPSFVVLTEDFTAEEIVDEVERFRKSHQEMRILLYDRAETDLFEEDHRLITKK